MQGPRTNSFQVYRKSLKNFPTGAFRSVFSTHQSVKEIKKCHMKFQRSCIALRFRKAKGKKKTIPKQTANISKVRRKARTLQSLNMRGEKSTTRRTKLIDISKQHFGRLAVVRRIPNIPKVPNSQWLCRCKCGRETVVSSNSLRR